MIEPYNYNDEPSGRSETLVQALERCERLEKALFIAVCTLETYADTENWRDIFEEDGDDSEYHTKSLYFANEGYKAAQSALKQIKELENKNKIFSYMGKPVDALTYIEKKIEYERKELEK